MPEESDRPERESPQPEAAASTPVHAHTWRQTWNPDGSASRVCDCGAIQDG